MFIFMIIENCFHKDVPSKMITFYRCYYSFHFQLINSEIAFFLKNIIEPIIFILNIADH